MDEQGVLMSSPPPKKVIIDTDPGVDDAMAILLAFESPELEVIGLTTIFGNVYTPTATKNAIHLCELAGQGHIPVAQGEEALLNGEKKVRVADFVHGTDGLGNTNQPSPSGTVVSLTGPQFLVDEVNKNPGEITIIALGPLTNLARAVELDTTFPQKLKQLIILGGAFGTNGNVNPAAEANIFGDPEAADAVLTCGANTMVVGVNITHQVLFTVSDFELLRDSDGPYGRYIYDIAQFYLKYHKDAYDMDAVYVHDPTTIVAAIDPSLFTFKEGVVRVQTCGITKGLTLLDQTARWDKPTQWCGIPKVKVAVTVNADGVVNILKQRLTRPSRLRAL